MLTLRGEIMTRPMTKIVNGSEEIVREMTEEEHQEFLDNQEFLAQHHEAVAAAKSAAEAKLTALGLTIEDFKALGL